MMRFTPSFAVVPVVAITVAARGDANYASRYPKDDAALPSQEMEVGEEFSYRYNFQVPKNADLSSITFGQNKNGHIYRLDLTKKL